MTLFAILLALVLEQIRPLPQRAAADELIVRVCAKAAELYNDGSVANGRIAWLLVVLGGGLATLLLHYLLLSVHPFLAFVFSAGALYLVLGFRRDERMFTEVQQALADEDVDEACRRLKQWCGRDCSGAGGDELARLAVEHAITVSHRGIFGVLFWFVVLPGPAGAVMYRLSRQLYESWSEHGDEALLRFGEFSALAFAWVDWLPSRITAIAFSIIGNFEDALYCWRTQAALWPDRVSGVLLAAAAGALGLRLGMPMHVGGVVVDRPELGLGVVVDVDRMPRAARLIWRVLVLFVLLLALLAIAGWVGR